MITSQVVGNEGKEVKYPLLARLRIDDEIIVLFLRGGCGTILKCSTPEKVGVYKEDLIPISNWEILPNDFKVILQNTDI